MPLNASQLVGCPLTGDLNLAKRIEGNGNCGITYYFAGFCHQMTNRILRACPNNKRDAWIQGQSSANIEPKWTHDNYPVVSVPRHLIPITLRVRYLRWGSYGKGWDAHKKNGNSLVLY